MTTKNVFGAVTLFFGQNKPKLHNLTVNLIIQPETKRDERKGNKATSFECIS